MEILAAKVGYSAEGSWLEPYIGRIFEAREVSKDIVELNMDYGHQRVWTMAKRSYLEPLIKAPRELYMKSLLEKTSQLVKDAEDLNISTIACVWNSTDSQSGLVKNKYQALMESLLDIEHLIDTL